MDTPQNTDDTAIVVKSKLAEFLLNQLKRHGLPILLLSIAVYYFHGEVSRCNERLIHLYEANNAKMIEVIGNNTHALERLVREDQYRRSREN